MSGDEFVEQLADTPLAWHGGGRWRCPRCGSIAASDAPAFPHTPGCPVLRAQQVRDAARGAAPAPIRDGAWDECVECGASFPTGGRCSNRHAAPVSPGGGPPVESEDRELVEAVAQDICTRLYTAIEHGAEDHRAWLREKMAAFVPTLVGLLAARERRRRALCGHVAYRDHEDLCVDPTCPRAAYQGADARADHLARTAPVAAVAPVAGPLVGDEGLVEAVGLAMYQGPEFPILRHEHVRTYARAALRVVDAHLATRALRPAREVAHEALGGLFAYGVALSQDEQERLMARVTAAIERDRAGGRR